LTAPQSRNVEIAVKVWTKKGLSGRPRKQQVFLDSVQEKSRGCSLLCAIAYSQNRIGATPQHVLDSLLRKIENNKEDDIFTRADILAYAAEYKIPGAVQVPQQNRQTQNERVFAYASLQRIGEVFNKSICDAIRRVTVNEDSKAAVTMIFPIWGKQVNYAMMSLDVCEQDMVRLAMALFNVQLQLVEGVLHVVLSSGTTLIISDPKITLKGVPDEVILNVFGPAIYNAVTKCPARENELVEGKYVTECVSMTITKNKATIDLSLDLEGGLEIGKKLYSLSRSMQ
jgi:hypothetical protein